MPFLLDTTSFEIYKPFFPFPTCFPPPPSPMRVLAVQVRCLRHLHRQPPPLRREAGLRRGRRGRGRMRRGGRGDFSRKIPCIPRKIVVQSPPSSLITILLWDYSLYWSCFKNGFKNHFLLFSLQKTCKYSKKRDMRVQHFAIYFSRDCWFSRALAPAPPPSASRLRRRPPLNPRRRRRRRRRRRSKVSYNPMNRIIGFVY